MKPDHSLRGRIIETIAIQVATIKGWQWPFVGALNKQECYKHANDIINLIISVSEEKPSDKVCHICWQPIYDNSYVKTSEKETYANSDCWNEQNPF